MNTKSILCIAVLLAVATLAAGQGKPFLTPDQRARLRPADPTRPVPQLRLPAPAVPPAGRAFDNLSGDGYVRMLAAPRLLSAREGRQAEVVREPRFGRPIAVRGPVPHALNKYAGKTALENQVFSYLDAVRDLLGWRRPVDEFTVDRVETDALGQTHVRLQQRYRGLEVYGVEIILHLSKDEVTLFNGRSFPTPAIPGVEPKIGRDGAVRSALDHVRRYATVRPLSEWERQFVGGEPVEARLVVFHPDDDPSVARLAWVVGLIPNPIHHWTYLIDAQSGAILRHHSEICQLHPDDGHHRRDVRLPAPASPSPLPADGPRTAQAADLFGRQRTINTYQVGAQYFLQDASRQMFNLAQSQMPGSPVGILWTVDARSAQPQDGSYSLFQIQSADNRWNDPKAVSAHYNAGLVFEYYRSTFGRNSYNDAGGNLISVINVVEEDGAEMDNAFWNGRAMFYGNFRQIFTAPVAKALDVAAHEMTHGVISSSARLEYLNESGALNESFADIFAVMVDRDDWKLAEDIMNTAAFPTGALRDMANPNNGRTGFGQRGWQPAHYNERYQGSDDNGGVHINSGIGNHAFYLFATQVGKETAEKVYYRALTTYLVRSSQFVDLRVAVLQAARDLFNENVAQAAQNALNQVGIPGGQGGNYQEEVDPNPGASFIFYSDNQQSALYLAAANGTVVSNPFFNQGVIGRVSVTDDGSLVLFVGADRRLYYVQIDWRAGSVVASGRLDDQPIWRTVAVSKDGARVAALDGSFDDPGSLSNTVLVYDLVRQEGRWFELYNPTTSTAGARTGDVLFADRLEWDFSGQFLLYDAYNELSSNSGPIDYWDIGLLRAWDNRAEQFGDGLVLKLFEGLPEGVTIGNPTLAKNAPFIMAFDYTEAGTDTYDTYGYNIQTGDLGLIFQGNSLPGVPSYATDDGSVIFDAVTTSGAPVIATVAMNANKIQASGNARVLIQNATTGVFFATGSRELTAVDEAWLAGSPVRLFPNPARDRVTLDFALPRPETVRFDLFDALGRRLRSHTLNAPAGAVREQLPLGGLPAGAYRLRISAGKESVVRTVVVK